MSAPLQPPLALAHLTSLSLDALRASGLDARDIDNLFAVLGWHDDPCLLAKAAECIEFPEMLREVTSQCVNIRRLIGYHTGDATIGPALAFLAAMQVGYAMGRVAERKKEEK